MAINRTICKTVKPGQIIVRTVRTDKPTDIAVAGHLHQLLPPDELQEAQRFHKSADRNRFIISRSLLRLMLSHHFSVSPVDWVIGRGDNGRPFIVAPEMLPPIEFSISHTEGLVACLITISAEAAVDVEKVVYTQDLALTAKHVLSAAEQDELAALSGPDWTKGFFDHWTLKEAYAKARGLGLVLQFKDVGFELKSNNTILVHFAGRVDDNPSAWTFWNHHLRPQHSISVAAKRCCSKNNEVILGSVKFDGINLVPDLPLTVLPPEKTCADVESGQDLVSAS